LINWIEWLLDVYYFFVSKAKQCDKLPNYIDIDNYHRIKKQR
jgi:hypothetical protein